MTTYHYPCGCLVVGDGQQRLRFRTPCVNTQHAPIEPGAPGYATVHDTDKHDCFDRRCELKGRRP